MVSSYSFVLGAMCISGVNSAADTNSWNWNRMSQERKFGGDAAGTFEHFDSVYMMGLIGQNGQDHTVLHQPTRMPEVKLSSMEKVTAMTAVSTRASIRSQLVGLLKSQVRIESMYGTKKEKLYLAASSIYNFISTLLHSACQIALNNDVLWKEQMQCFDAYRSLLEVYSMWNGVRDVSFALEHGMAVSEETLATCGDNVALKEHFVSQTGESNRLQNQYLVAATEKSCLDNMQVKIEALRTWLSRELVSMDSQQDRAQACLFRVITVLTCLSSGNQEAILDLAIREEHKQHVVFSLARYASVALHDAAEQEAANSEAGDETAANRLQMDEVESSGSSEDAAAASSFAQLRDARPFGR